MAPYRSLTPAIGRAAAFFHAFRHISRAAPSNSPNMSVIMVLGALECVYRMN
jgi:hypothetical protein